MVREKISNKPLYSNMRSHAMDDLRIADVYFEVRSQLLFFLLIIKLKSIIIMTMNGSASKMRWHIKVAIWQ